MKKKQPTCEDRFAKIEKLNAAVSGDLWEIAVELKAISEDPSYKMDKEGVNRLHAVVRKNTHWNFFSLMKMLKVAPTKEEWVEKDLQIIYDRCYKDTNQKSNRHKQKKPQATIPPSRANMPVYGEDGLHQQTNGQCPNCAKLERENHELLRENRELRQRTQKVR